MGAKKAAKKKVPFEVVETPADDTTLAQGAAYYTAYHMLAEAKQPRTKAEMREEMTGLLRQVRREAKRLTVPYEQWDAECERRLRELLTALGYKP